MIVCRLSTGDKGFALLRVCTAEIPRQATARSYPAAPSFCHSVSPTTTVRIPCPYRDYGHPTFPPSLIASLLLLSLPINAPANLHLEPHVHSTTCLPAPLRSHAVARPHVCNDDPPCRPPPNLPSCSQSTNPRLFMPNLYPHYWR